MKRQTRKIWASVFVAALALISVHQAKAADALAICASGEPFRYPNGGTDVPFNPDQGGLGPLTNAQGVAAVQTAFDAWENLSQSSMTSLNNGLMPFDVDITNFGPILNPSAPDGLSPIVFDEDGSIFELLFGAGSGILGFAGPDFGDFATCGLIEGSSFLNGPTFTDAGVAEDIMVHEFGHYINLGHVELNGQLIAFSEGGDDTGPTPNNGTFPVPPSLAFLIETMYPFYFGPTAGTRTPHADDIASVSTLYPAADFASTTGSISGRIFSGLDGDIPISGVNVIARNIADPFDDAVSTFSGAYTNSTNPADPNVGTYVLNGLTPGEQYAVFVDVVTAQPGRFSNPIITSLPGPEEFYNGANESTSSLSDDPQEAVLLMAQAGAPSTNVDIRFNVPQPGEPLNLGDDGNVELFMPFEFEFCGVEHNSVFVNANGNLTFGTGDFSFFGDVPALLDGPPRIAPFWRDLNPSQGGTVFYSQSNNSFTVTYDQVPNWFGGGTNSFSVTLSRASNRIEIDYGDLDPTTFDFVITATSPGITGISCGISTTSGLEGSSDLSSLARSTINLQNQPAVYEEFEEVFDSESGTFVSTVDLENTTLNFNGTTNYNDNWAEPNDSFGKARSIKLPFNSSPLKNFTEISPAGNDADHYRFTANAGDYLIAEVTRSQLDSLMCVFDPSGALIDSNDDSNGLLSKVITKLPVDGEYRVAVTTFPDFDCSGDGNTSPVFGMGRYILDMSLYEQPAGELIFNGSFELGFSGWTAFEDGVPFIPWSIGQAGGGSGFGMQPLQPQDGSNVAWNGFDGAVGTRFIMLQDFDIPSGTNSATLSWKDRIQWNFFSPTPLQPRVYRVFLFDAVTGDFVALAKGVNSGTAPGGAVDLGWQEGSLDLTPYAGRSLRLLFLERIPEDFTGPGQLEIDDVSVTID